MTIRVALVDDHEVIGHGLQMYFEKVGGVNLIWVAQTLSEAKLHLDKDIPEVFIIDLRFDSIQGLELLSELSANLCCIVYSSYDSQLHVQEAFRRGAFAFVRKSEPLDHLKLAIKNASEGKKTVTTMDKSHLSEAVKVNLSERELEVLKMVFQGFGNTEIAKQLKISQTTVKTHLKRIYFKLGTSNRGESIHIALEKGLIFPFSVKNLSAEENE